MILLPPLRARQEDIPVLAEHFAISMAKELDREYFAGFTQTAMDTLLDYDWPGNVRELKNVVERCVYRIDPEGPVEEVVFDPFASPFRPTGRYGHHHTTTVQETVEDSERDSPFTTDFPVDLKEHIKNQEIELINAALTEAKHNQRKAADLLQLTYHQLRGYLKKYDLVGPASETESEE